MNLRARVSALFLLTAGAIGNTFSKDDPDGLPTNLLAYQPPAFPVELKRTLTTDGYATVAFAVRPDGYIDDAVVLEATHAAFGEAVLQVLPSWRFASATDGELPRREVLRFMFRQIGTVTPLSHREAAKAMFPASTHERLPIRTLRWSQLSDPPERLVTKSPWLEANRAGKVAVSFVIDTNGKVRVPIVDSTYPELGMAVLAAVKQWRFAPPMRDGQSVLVEDTRSFTFAAKGGGD